MYFFVKSTNFPVVFFPPPVMYVCMYVCMCIFIYVEREDNLKESVTYVIDTLTSRSMVSVVIIVTYFSNLKSKKFLCKN